MRRALSPRRQAIISKADQLGVPTRGEDGFSKPSTILLADIINRQIFEEQVHRNLEKAGRQTSMTTAELQRQREELKIAYLDTIASDMDMSYGEKLRALDKLSGKPTTEKVREPSEIDKVKTELKADMAKKLNKVPTQDRLPVLALIGKLNQLFNRLDPDVETAKLGLTDEESTLYMRYPGIVNSLKYFSIGMRKAVRGMANLDHVFNDSHLPFKDRLSLQQKLGSLLAVSKLTAKHKAKVIDRLIQRAKDGIGYESWTEEQQWQLDDEINDLFAGDESLFLALLDDPDVSQLNLAMQGVQLADLTAEIKEIFDVVNARVRQEAADINKKVRQEAADITYDTTFAEKISEESYSVQLNEERVGKKAPFAAKIKHIGIKVTAESGAFFPLDFETYGEVMYRVAEFFGVDFASNRFRQSGRKGLSAGAISMQSGTYDLTDRTTRYMVDRMTLLFGPTWPLILEAASYYNENSSRKRPRRLLKMAAVMKSAQADLLAEATRKKPILPQGARMAGAFITAQSQWDNPVHATEIAGTSVATKVRSLITPYDVCDAFARLGLPSDGSPIDISRMSSDTVKQDLEVIPENLREQVGAALSENAKETKAEDESIVEADFSTIDKFNVVIDMSLTAEQATREVYRDYTEAMNPQIEGSRAGQSQTLQVVDKYGRARGQGLHSSNRSIAMIGLNAKNVSTPLNRYKTVNNYALLGQLINDTFNRFEGILASMSGTDTESIARQRTLPADLQKASELYSTVQAKLVSASLLSKVDASPLAAQLETAMIVFKQIQQFAGSKVEKTASDAAIRDYLEADPEASYANMQIDLMKQTLRDITGIYGQSDTSLITPAVAARTMNGVNNLMNSLRDMQNFRLMLDTMKMSAKWNEIFGVPPVEKFRDILGLMWKTVTAKTVDDAVSPYGVSQVSQQWSLASVFACNALNADEVAIERGKNPMIHLESIKQSVVDYLAKMTELAEKRKLTVSEQYRVQEYERYLAVMPLATEIINKTGEYGAKVNEFIQKTYKPMTDLMWDNLDLESVATGQKLDFWVPRLFTHDGTDSATAADQMTFYQLVGRLMGRKITLGEHMLKGEVLSHRNLLGSFQAGMKQIIHTRANKNFINHNIHGKQFFTAGRPGFKKLDAAGTKYVTFTIQDAEGHEPPEAGVYEELKEALGVAKELGCTSRQVYDIVPHAEDVYAPAAIADHVNKITKASIFRSTDAGSAIMSTNAKLKMIKIAWGMFHRRAFTWSAMMAGPAPVGYEWKSKDHSAWEKIKKRFDYLGTREFGKKLMEENNYEMFAIINFGGTAFTRQDIGVESLDYKTTFDKWIAMQPKNAVSSAMKESLYRLGWWTDVLQNELFGVFGGTLKMATAVRETRRLILENTDKIAAEKKVSEETNKKAENYINFIRTFPEQAENIDVDWHSDTEAAIYSAVAGLGNADFGGLHTKRLGLSESHFDFFRLLFLGPDWTLSNFQTVSKLWLRKGTDVVGGANTWTSGSEIERQLYLHFWGRIIARVALIVTVINLAMAGFDDETILERTAKAKKAGKLKIFQADISPIMHMFGGNKSIDHYVNVGGQFLDPVKWAFDPVRSAVNKGSSISRPVVSLIGGTNYRHQRPSTIGNIASDGLYSNKSFRRGPLSPLEMPAALAQESINVWPIQMQKVMAFAQGEENAIAAVLEGAIGLEVNQTFNNK